MNYVPDSSTTKFMGGINKHYITVHFPLRDDCRTVPSLSTLPAALPAFGPVLAPLLDRRTVPFLSARLALLLTLATRVTRRLVVALAPSCGISGMGDGGGGGATRIEGCRESYDMSGGCTGREPKPGDTKWLGI